MKKILIILLVCLCFLASGCSYGGAGLVMNSNGSVVEYYYVPFPEKELLENGATVDQLNKVLINLKNYLEIDTQLDPSDGLFAQLINSYQSKIAQSDKYTLEQKTALVSGVTYKMTLVDNNDDNYQDGIRFLFNFANSTCYAEFKNINNYISEEKTVEKINNFFTTTTKVVKDPIFDKITSSALTIGTTCLNLVDQQMTKVFGLAGWEIMKYNLNYNKYSSMFEYTYTVPTTRIHTNADSISKDSNGYYYHTWKVNLNNLDETGNSKIQIEYWTITANKWVWYVGSLVVAGLIITACLFTKKKNNNFMDLNHQTNKN